MNIHGFQKMTLLDFPGRVACTVFLGGCDFRCPFCHNAELLDASVPAETDSSKVLSFLETRRGLLDGVAVTGGEPCLRRDLPDFLQAIRDLGFAVKLDTNGNHPEMLRTVLSRHLADYVAMDIKNSPEHYSETVGLENFDLSRIRMSVNLLMESDTDYEFRTTVVDELHSADSFLGIGQWIRGAKRYFLQPFVDRDTVVFDGLHAPDSGKMAEYLEIMREFVPVTQIRGE